MNRNIKNIVMITLLCLLILTNIITVKLAHDSVNTNFNMINIEMRNNNKGHMMPEFNQEMNDQNTIRQMKNDNTKNFNVVEPNNINSKNLNALYYVLFGIQGFLISVIGIYLVLSNFNKKDFKETISSKDKIIIIALCSAILTIGITYIEGFISKGKNNIPINDVEFRIK